MTTNRGVSSEKGRNKIRHAQKERTPLLPKKKKRMMWKETLAFFVIMLTCGYLYALRVKSSSSSNKKKKKRTTKKNDDDDAVDGG